jgi:rhodanese-related sulfurtransferase
MILKQFYLGCLAHASYLLGDEESGTAVVVDPQRDIQLYVSDAEKFGVRIRHVFLSHFHADFVAGHLELRDACGAAIHLGSRAQAEYSFVPMNDGDAIEFPGNEVPRNRRIAVHCAGGYRSSIAVSILHQHGITNLIEIAGGLAAWDAAELPVVSETAPQV